MSEEKAKNDAVVKFDGNLNDVNNLDLQNDKLKFITAIPGDQLAAKLASLEIVSEVTAEYLEIAKGEVLRCVYLNQTVFRTTDENTKEEIRRPAVLLRTKDGTFISAGTVLVNALINLPDFTAVEIQNFGKKGTGSRKYDDYKVFLLDSN